MTRPTRSRKNGLAGVASGFRCRRDETAGGETQAGCRSQRSGRLMTMRAKSRVRGGQLQVTRVPGLSGVVQSCLVTGVEVLCRGMRTAQFDMNNHEMRRPAGGRSVSRVHQTRSSSGLSLDLILCSQPINGALEKMDARVDVEWARPWLIVRDDGWEPGRVSGWFSISHQTASKDPLGPKVGDEFEPGRRRLQGLPLMGWRQGSQVACPPARSSTAASL